LALLAGRKLLLADDSLTIQKVVEITFADEGVAVVSLGSGDEALAKLVEFGPDIVLADVCMPPPNGYEICEYIKQNAELRHIPVMLLVGSFEPFDEAEARRVGADDILTKPFQSIRRLIDKVGGLVSAKQDPDQVPTAELPQVEPPAPEKMSTDEIELTTANTQPLPQSLADQFAAHPFKASSSKTSADVATPTEHEPAMETTNQLQTETIPDQGEVLLDLGDLSPTAPAPEDFVLDIDLDETPQPALAEAWSGSTRSPAFVEPQVSAPVVVDWQIESGPNGMPPISSAGPANASAVASAQMDDTLEWMRKPGSTSQPPADVPPAEASRKLERVLDEPVESRPVASVSGSVNANQLSPEVIDAIARRAVEQLSEKVVQQIAWEVVPQLAELMIKRRLEEKESQPK
jgi:CheY-like chemotaxis protein